MPDEHELFPLTDLESTVCEDPHLRVAPAAGNMDPLLDVGTLLAIGELSPLTHSGTASPTSYTTELLTANHSATPPGEALRLNIADKNKLNRLMKNRESARKCREKKKRTIANLEARMLALEQENAKLRSDQLELRRRMHEWPPYPALAICKPHN